MSVASLSIIKVTTIPDEPAKNTLYLAKDTSSENGLVLGLTENNDEGRISIFKTPSAPREQMVTIPAPEAIASEHTLALNSSISLKFTCTEITETHCSFSVAIQLETGGRCGYRFSLFGSGTTVSHARSAETIALDMPVVVNIDTDLTTGFVDELLGCIVDLQSDKVYYVNVNGAKDGRLFVRLSDYPG